MYTEFCRYSFVALYKIPSKGTRLGPLSARGVALARRLGYRPSGFGEVLRILFVKTMAFKNAKDVRDIFESHITIAHHHSVFQLAIER